MLCIEFLVGIAWHQMQIENILGLECQVQNSGEGHSHMNTQLHIQRNDQMIFMTLSWL